MRTKNLMLLATILFCIVSASAQNYVTLYSDCNYRGASQSFKTGQYQLSQSRIGGGNLSSFQVPAGMKLVIYTGSTAGQGNKTHYTTDVSCLGRDWNDKTYSISVEMDGGVTQLPGNTPVNNQMATLYEDCNFRGRASSLSAGYHDWNRLGINNKQLSSFSLPQGWSITLYENSNYSGRNITYSSGVSCLSRDWNDRASSVLISSSGSNNSNNNNTNNAMVTLYSDCNYRGAAKSLGAGYHRSYDLGIGNDQLSSIKVPYGWSITVYSDENFKGRSASYSGDVYCFNREWNDQVSSVLITRNDGGNNQGNNNNNPTDYVILYENENYTGRSVTLRPGSIPDLNTVGFSPRSLSSLKLPRGWSVMLYDRTYYGGNSYKVLQSKDRFLFSGWNDKAVSLIIYNNGGKY